MATYYSQGSGAWSTLTNWDTVRTGGGTDPASVADMDDDTFVIQPGHSIEFDIDSSGWSNGINGITIEGHATSTPGMLYAKHSGAGTYYLKLKTGTSIAGSSVTVTTGGYGRLLANSDGVWGNTGALPFDRKFVIDLGTTATLNTAFLTVALRCAEPSFTSVRTYGVLHTVTGSASSDTLTKTAHGITLNTKLMFRVTGGSLPAPLTSTDLYYAVNIATDTFKVSLTANGAGIDLTTDGSGTIECYTGHSDTGTATMNVLDDVTGDAQWASGAPVVLVNTFSSDSVDYQRSTLSGAPAAGSLSLGENIDSAQAPGAQVWLVSRNVAIRGSSTNATQTMVSGSTATTADVVTLCCEIRNTAAGTTGTNYTLGVNGGARIAVTGGVLSGLNNAVANIVGPSSVAGVICACNIGLSQCHGNWLVTGILTGSTTGVTYSTGGRLDGALLSACQTGINECWGGSVENTAFTGVAYSFSAGSYNESNLCVFRNVGCVVRILGYNIWTVRSADIRGAQTAEVLRSSQQTRYWYAAAHFAQYGGAENGHRTFTPNGDYLLNASVLRTGGASSSIEVVPNSYCSIAGFLPILEWTEADVAVSAQTRSLYIKGSGWNAGDWPEDEELWFEAEYYDSGSDFGRTTVTTTTHLDTGGAWTQYSLSFTPGRVGPVVYRAFLAKYYSGAAVYVDNALYA